MQRLEQWGFRHSNNDSSTIVWRNFFNTHLNFEFFADFRKRETKKGSFCKINKHASLQLHLKFVNWPLLVPGAKLIYEIAQCASHVHIFIYIDEINYIFIYVNKSKQYFYLCVYRHNFFHSEAKSHIAIASTVRAELDLECPKLPFYRRTCPSFVSFLCN